MGRLAKMAAALGDRAGVVKHLNELYDSGSVLSVWIPAEPLFKPYLRDSEIAALLTKHAERRATWRKQLAAEGLSLKVVAWCLRRTRFRSSSS